LKGAKVTLGFGPITNVTRQEQPGAPSIESALIPLGFDAAPPTHTPQIWPLAVVGTNVFVEVAL
jgi:hypothetical protein